MKKSIITVVVFCIFTFFGCSPNNETNRYIVISTGCTDGTPSSILDTKTREVYSINLYKGGPISIYKKTLDDAKNSD